MESTKPNHFKRFLGKLCPKLDRSNGPSSHSTKTKLVDEGEKRQAQATHEQQLRARYRKDQHSQPQKRPDFDAPRSHAQPAAAARSARTLDVPPQLIARSPRLTEDALVRGLTRCPAPLIDLIPQHTALRKPGRPTFMTKSMVHTRRREDSTVSPVTEWLDTLPVSARLDSTRDQRDFPVREHSRQAAKRKSYTNDVPLLSLYGNQERTVRGK